MTPTGILRLLKRLNAAHQAGARTAFRLRYLRPGTIAHKKAAAVLERHAATYDQIAGVLESQIKNLKT